MTDNSSPAAHAHHLPASEDSPGRSPHARFEFLPAGEGKPATVHASGDIDLSNVAQFQAALDQAAAASTATADLTEVTYCDSAAIRALIIAARRTRLTIQISAAGPLTETLLEISGLDQVAKAVTLD
jgi:anti-anti-sigma factor